MLDDLDQELTQRGNRFVRYADDLMIYGKSRRVGERVMQGTRRRGEGETLPTSSKGDVGPSAAPHRPELADRDDG